MCIGTTGCRFGKISSDSPEAVDRQAIEGFRSGDLVGSSLVGVTMPQKFSNARLAMADLSKAVFPGTSYERINLVDANMFGVKVPAVNTGPDAYAHKFNNAQLSYSRLVGADIANADFTSASLRGVDLRDASLQTVNLNLADLTGARLEGISSFAIAGRPLLPDGWRIVVGHLVGPRAVIDDPAALRDFRESNLQPSSVPNIPYSIGAGSSCVRWWNSMNQFMTQRGSMYRQVNPTLNFSSANLEGANLEGIVFGRTDLHDARLMGASLRNADLTGANLRGADLRGVDLSGANLTGADLSGARLTGARVNGIRTLCTLADYATMKGLPGFQYSSRDTPVTVVKPGQSMASAKTVYLRSGIIYGPGVDLSGLNLAGMDTKQVSLDGAIMGGVTSGSVGDMAIVRTPLLASAARWPAGWRVENGLAIGPGADLSFADLRKMKFTGSFAGVLLDGVVSGSTTIVQKETLPKGWTLAHGYLVGKRVTLNGANFAGDTFDGTDMTEANLDGSSFAGATFRSVRAGGITGTVRMPSGWFAVKGVILGPTADLEGVELSLVQERIPGQLDLSGAVLAGSTLTDFPSAPRLPAGYVYVTDGPRTGPGLVLGPDVNLAGLSFVTSDPAVKGVSLPAGWVVADNGPGNYVLLGPGTEMGRNATPRGRVTGVDLSGVNADGVGLSGLELNGARGFDLQASDRQLPRGWKVVGDRHVLVGPTADLTDMDLSGANLSGVNLSQAKMQGVSGRFVRTGPGTVLPYGWGVVNNVLVGPGADLRDVVLVGADLRGIILVGAKFSYTRIIYARNANDKRIVNGTLVAPGADIVCSPIAPVTVRQNIAVVKELVATLSQLGRLPENGYEDPNLCRLGS